MKLLFIFSLSLLFNNPVLAQDINFRQGIIVTKSDDTIYCQVPITTHFENKVIIKREKNGKQEIIPLEQIKYLANSDNVYENISYKKGRKEIQKLMWLEIEGKLNLYLEIAESFQKMYENENVRAYYSPAIKTYVIKKDNKNFLIEKRDFIKSIKLLMEGFPELVTKVETFSFTYDNIEDLINEYNRLSEK